MFDAAFAWFLGTVGALFVVAVAHSMWRMRRMRRDVASAAVEYLDQPAPDSLWTSRVVSYGALFACAYGALGVAGPRNAEGAAGLVLVGAIGPWAVAMIHWTLHHVAYSIEDQVFTARCGLLVARTPLDAVRSVTRTRLSPWHRGWRGWLERGSFLVNHPEVVRIGLGGNRAIYVSPSDADELMRRLRLAGARIEGGRLGGRRER